MRHWFPRADRPEGIFSKPTGAPRKSPSEILFVAACARVSVGGDREERRDVGESVEPLLHVLHLPGASTNAAAFTCKVKMDVMMRPLLFLTRVFFLSFLHVAPALI